MPSDGHPWGDDGLEIPYRCWAELNELQQLFMSRDFVFRRIAQDAFDPIALADEVDESGVSSVNMGGSQSFPGFSFGALGAGKRRGRLG
jgi:hypothetical protein